MRFPEDFEPESLYTRDQWYIHELVAASESEVVGICDTRQLADSPIVLAQRDWPGQPKHVPGIIMVQITGTLGNIHAVSQLGLRMSEGWVGFGTNILEAKFRGLGTIGPALRCSMKVEGKRELKGQIFVTYAFRYEQEGRLVFSSRQRASWMRHVAKTE